MTTTHEHLPESPMVIRSLGRLMVIRCATGMFSESVWGEFLRTLHAHDLATLRVFVRTDGAAPSSMQLRALVRELSGRPVPFAIVTDEGRVRFVISALAMMTKRIRSFPVAQQDEAFQYLQLTPDEVRFATRFVDDAGARPGGPARS